MRIELVQRASAQLFENLNGRLGLTLGPQARAQAVCACSLNPLYSHSARRRMERNLGSHYCNASLRATDSLMTTVRL